MQWLFAHNKRLKHERTETTLEITMAFYYISRCHPRSPAKVMPRMDELHTGRMRLRQYKIATYFPIPWQI